ncbi:TPA: hypothetical protein ACPJ1N_004586 [Vibrio diabolicus]
MKKPINKLVVWATVPLTIYALIDIASNIRGLHDKYEDYLSGYSIIRDLLYVWIPKLVELPNWFTAYIATGFLFKFALVLLKMLHPYSKQPSWGEVLLTAVRHILAWPIVLINFVGIAFFAWKRGDLQKSEQELGSKNYNALAYVKSIFQYIGVVLIGFVIISVAIGAW